MLLAIANGTAINITPGSLHRGSTILEIIHVSVRQLTRTGSYQRTHAAMSCLPDPPDGEGSPLLMAAVTTIHVILYVLGRLQDLVAWLTITLPRWVEIFLEMKLLRQLGSMVVRMLQYSFTISLGFPSLLGLFVATSIALTFLIRYRYLARYTQLKEPALPPPSPPSLTAELSPLTTSGLSDARNRSSPYHNYLDDFLAAIRIFGYLEKPVFHELSRHLQTRRLAAGETLEIGGGDFWCVVDGKVQVVSTLRFI